MHHMCQSIFQPDVEKHSDGSYGQCEHGLMTWYKICETPKNDELLESRQAGFSRSYLPHEPLLSLYFYQNQVLSLKEWLVAC